ncbi:MAG: hypothetical protein ACYTEO_20045 [Planctomycetota bacterium]|jgi:hypothetical protein
MIKRHEINDRIIDLIQANPEARPFEIADMIMPQVELSRVAVYDRVLRMRNQLKADDEREAPSEVDDTDKMLLKILKTRKPLIDVSNALDISPKSVEARVEVLKDKGYNIEVEGHEVELHREAQPEPRFGALADTHLCNARLDVLNALYDVFEHEDIHTVYHGGNYIDGEFRYNKHELIVPPGFESQVEYFVSNYPNREGIETFFIDGDDHEGWYYQREGIIPGRRIEQSAEGAGRADLKYLGYGEADISYPTPDGQTIVRLSHGGGGSAYALSYTPQKIIESYQGGEKPHMALFGHYHKTEWMPFYREVQVFQLACVEDQTLFMRKRKLQAHVGGWIIEFKQRPDGTISRVRGEFFPFYDRGYHIKYEANE